MANRSKHLRIIKSHISEQTFHELEALRYSHGISRSSLIRLILEHKIEKLIKLLGQKEITEFTA